MGTTGFCKGAIAAGIEGAVGSREIRVATPSIMRSHMVLYENYR
jgi:hypothetical protein